MPTTRLPLAFARASAWLAVGMLLFPWADLAHCNCGPGTYKASPRQAASTCCYKTRSRTDSCCGSRQDVPDPSCRGSTDACRCRPACQCGCLQPQNPQPPQTPQPASPKPLEQITWGLVARAATVGCTALDRFSQSGLNLFQQGINPDPTLLSITTHSLG